MSTHNNFHDSTFNAFIDSTFNARTGGTGVTVCGTQSSTWENSGGRTADLWRGGDNLSFDWAYNSGTSTADCALDVDSGVVYLTANRGSTTWKADANDTPGPGTAANVWAFDRNGVVLWTHLRSAIADTGDITNAVIIANGANGCYVTEPRASATNRGLHKITGGTRDWLQQFNGMTVRRPGTSSTFTTAANCACIQVAVVGGTVWAAVHKDSVIVTAAAARYLVQLSTSTGAVIDAYAPNGPLNEFVCNSLVADGTGAYLQRSTGMEKRTTLDTVAWTLSGVPPLGLALGNGRLYACGAVTTGWQSSPGVAGPGTSKNLWCANKSTGAVLWAWNSGASLNDVSVTPQGNIVAVGIRSSTWHADANGTPGAGTPANAWLLTPGGVVLDWWDLGSTLQGLTGAG